MSQLSPNDNKARETGVHFSLCYTPVKPMGAKNYFC